jgi:hypothetical protein
MQPRVTGNHALSKRAETGAIKTLLDHGCRVLPIHTLPTGIVSGRVVARCGTSIPDPTRQTVSVPKWRPV